MGRIRRMGEPRQESCKKAFRTGAGLHNEQGGERKQNPENSLVQGSTNLTQAMRMIPITTVMTLRPIGLKSHVIRRYSSVG